MKAATWNIKKETGG